MKLNHQEILCSELLYPWTSYLAGSQGSDLVKLLQLQTRPEPSHAMIAKRVMDFLTLTTDLSSHHDENHEMPTSAWTFPLRTS
jgi:hypothetical protein